MKLTNSKQRFYVYTLLLLPLLLVIITGLGMLYYHGNGDYELILYGLDGHTWILWHKMSSVVMLPLVFLHLFKGTSWVAKGLF